MHKPFFRLCSLFLVLALLVNMLPMSIFAEEFQEAQAAAAAEEAAKVTDAQIVAEVEEKRTEYSKQFKLDNGLFVAAVYAEPVHYQDNGEWKDIDNTLKATSEGTYTNTAGVWDVSLPSQLTGKAPISITKDGHTLSFQMAGELTGTGELQTMDLSLDAASQPFSVSPTKSTQGQIRAIDFTEARESAEHEEFVLEKGTSQILYADVYENTDVQYDLQGNRVKESIIIDSYSSDLRGYRYILQTGQMAPVLNEDGSIYFYDKEDIVMVMPAPYLVDNNGECNYDIQVTLTGSDGAYTLSYILPQEWLAAEERAWPVVLDPAVLPDLSVLNIKDRTIASNGTFEVDDYFLECGYGPEDHIERFYIKYAELPEITSSDVIVYAEMNLLKPESSYNGPTIVEAHKVPNTWESEDITWEANINNYEETVEDFAEVFDIGTYTWEITDIVRGWYEGENTGVMFKASAATENAGGDSYKRFYSSDIGTNGYKPALVIAFRNNSGIESYWNYSTASAGRAGTGYVNTYTGNLTWTRSDIGFGGNRMPVSISHTYNLSDSAENNFGMGYGWRTNFNQRIYQWEEDDTYYVWEDGDGTAHYFKYDSYNTYKDEDGLELTLKTDKKYSEKKLYIKDKQGNTRYFHYDKDENIGYLIQKVNNQEDPSSITIAHTDTTGKFIDYITDGVNRKYDFTYNTDGLLSSIDYYSNGTSIIHTVSYTYTDGKLTTVTDNDGKTSNYSYETKEKPSVSGDETSDAIKGYALKTAKDIDGYELKYTYTGTTADYQTYRIESVEESRNTIQGGKLSFRYAHNQTTLTDHNNNVEILQFNNYGNVVCIQDDEGRAQFAKYTANDASETGKANQLRLSSKLQNTVSNLLDNSSFERGNTESIWGTSGYNIDSQIAYMGSKSLAITNGNVSGTAEITVQPGESYTFSAYVKADENATVYLNLRSGTNDYKSQTLKNCDWTRLETNYTNTSEQAVAVITPQIVATGTAYVDCVQLEMNPTASRYNLVDNGDFRNGSSGWSVGENAVDSENLVDKDPATAQLGGKVYHTLGNPTGENRISQTVNVSGGEGDTFVLTGWAKGDAVPTPEADDEDEQRYYGIVAKFNYTEDSKESKTYVAKFNPDTDSTVNWQYSAEMMVAEYPYSSITVYIAYDRSANEAWFDGIQLFKEEFGHSYTYDKDGNLTAVKDLQGKNTEYEYDDNGDLVTVTEKRENEDDLIKMTYDYDDYHNVETSISAEGLKQEYTYDDYGNNTSVTVLDANNSTGAKIITTYGYANEGNTLGYTTDSLGRTTYYYYNADTNVLEWTLYPEDLNAHENSQIDTKTYCSYDNMGRMTGTAARVDTGTTLFANYFYEDDYLKYIQTASTIYTFNNNDFGLRSEVKAGNHLLASYNYVDENLREGEVERNYYLQSLDYGNGDKVEYDYDDKGRMLSQTYEDGETVTYHYDNYGALASVTDSVPDTATGTTTERTTTYYYDFTDRLIKYVESGEDYNHSLSYEYDDKNRLKSTTEVLGEDSYTYSYTYDKDDRTSAITLNDAQRAYTFDKYGRTSEQLTNYITKTTDSDGKETESTTQVKKDTYTFTPFENNTSSQIASHTVYFGTPDANGNYAKSVEYVYTYDENGNITSISKKLPSASEQELIASYEYDTANQLIRENNNAGGFTHTWTYDNAGNITSRKEYGYTTGELETPSSVVSYTYPDTDANSVVWGDLLLAYNGAAIEYDTIGNPTDDGTWEYTWEHGRQLARMESDSATWDYTYNVDGLRTSKSNGTTTYNYTYTGDKLTCMTVGDDTLYFAYDASGVPMSVTYNDVTYYYVTNVQGDVIGLLDANGNQVVSYAYDAWGNPISDENTQTSEIAELNPLRYRSYVWDSETKLYYLQSRYYNPDLGRFINADAFATTGQGLLSNNMFAYCLNNPVNLIDNTGNFPWLVVLVVVACVALGATYGATTERNIAKEMKGQPEQPYKSTPSISPGSQYNNSKQPNNLSPMPNNGTSPQSGKGITTPQISTPQSEKDPLTTRDRLNNIMIGATMGLLVGGAIVLMGGAIACVAGYSSVLVPILGMTGKQAVAWGLLSYNVFPVITAPFLGMEMEPLEYPS